MSPNRSALLLVGLLLAGQFGLPATVQADPDSAAAAFKWINGGPITDTARADQVLDGVSANAAAHGIDPAHVRTAFENQIDATEGIEYTRFGQWKFDPVGAPTAAPDLSESRSAIDGFNKVMVDEMALQWNSLGSFNCTTDLERAKDAVANDRRLDDLNRHALSSATRSYCRTT